MDGTGLARPGDSGAVRWLAARHGAHVHIIATLARQDGAPAEPGSDFSPVRRACHRHGLHSTRRAAPGPVLRGRDRGALACRPAPQPARLSGTSQ